MILRDLEQKDAEFMLEWMHDKNVYSQLGKDFSSMTIDNCRKFIESANKDKESGRHYAIIDENDEYMGTISMKNIDRVHKRAEYAISCRTKAIGKGFAKRASEEMFERAVSEYGLDMLYLDVYDYNVRAQKLYLKLGFEQVEKPDFIDEEMDARLLWYIRELHD